MGDPSSTNPGHRLCRRISECLPQLDAIHVAPAFTHNVSVICLRQKDLGYGGVPLEEQGNENDPGAAGGGIVSDGYRGRSDFMATATSAHVSAEEGQRGQG